MKKAVIATLETITGLLFWLILLGCGLLGYGYSVGSGAATPALFPILIGLLLGWFLAVVTTGFIYLLLSINQSLSDIREGFRAAKD